MPSCQTMTYELHHASLENIPINTSSVSKMSLEVPLVLLGDIVSENLHRFHVNNFIDRPQTSDKSLVFSTITQTIEQLGSAEESVIAIIVPEDVARQQTILTSQTIFQDQQFTEEEDISSNESDRAEEILEMEHSYCRHDIDRMHLCETIAKLQSQVALLEEQEGIILARLRSLEEIFGQLKQDNVLSEEKIKIIEDCQSNLDFAVVQ
ncbi:THAP domain-containing protein 5 [Engystomops pustulosus]|uniref:THAP domain-containing protein 5 n=1 Tax=Engystomops pustulosus TaxID=76066 RepID=UPI003AFA2EA6